MDRDLHDIDDLFRKAMGEHQDAPSASVWDKLDKDLDKRKVVSISRKYYKLKWIAASLFLFSSAVAMYTWKVNSDMKKALQNNIAESHKKNLGSGSTGKTVVPGEPAEISKVDENIVADKNAATENPRVKQEESVTNTGNAVTLPDSASAIRKNNQALANSVSASKPGNSLNTKPVVDKNTIASNSSSSSGTNNRLDNSSSAEAKRNGASVAPDRVASNNTSTANSNKNPRGNFLPAASNNAARGNALTAGRSNSRSDNNFGRRGNLVASDNNRSGKPSAAGILHSGISDQQNNSLAKNDKPGTGKDDRQPGKSVKNKLPDNAPASQGEITATRELNSRESALVNPALSQLAVTNSLNNALRKTPSVNKSDLYFSPESIATATKLSTAHRPLFTVMPFYSFDHVSSKVQNDEHLPREFDRKEIKDKEEIGKTYSVGLLAGIGLNDQLNIETGLLLSSLTTTIKPKTIFAQKDNMGNVNFRFNSSAGYSVVNIKPSGPNPTRPGDSILALSSTNTLQYISVPLNLRYKIGTGKFTLNPGIGLAANFLSSGKIETQIAMGPVVEKPKGNRVQGLNPMYMSGSLSLGVNYSLNRTVAFSLMPTMRLGLGSINRDSPVKTVFNSYGIAAGLTFSF